MPEQRCPEYYWAIIWALANLASRRAATYDKLRGSELAQPMQAPGFDPQHQRGNSRRGAAPLSTVVPHDVTCSIASAIGQRLDTLAQ